MDHQFFCLLLNSKCFNIRSLKKEVNQLIYLFFLSFRTRNRPFNQLACNSQNAVAIENCKIKDCMGIARLREDHLSTIFPINQMSEKSHLIILKGRSKKNVFFGRPFPNLFTQWVIPTHPRVFVRLGEWGDLGGFWGVWTLFGNQPPHPPTFGKDIPKKNDFFLAASLSLIRNGIICVSSSI